MDDLHLWEPWEPLMGIASGAGRTGGKREGEQRASPGQWNDGAAINFMQGAFEKLKASEILTQAVQTDGQPPPATTTNASTTSAATGSLEANSTAATNCDPL